MQVPSPVARIVDAALEATVVLSFSRIGYEVRSRLTAWPGSDQLPGAGRRIVVTGANSGLGYAAARGLLAAGAEVLLAVRDEAKGDDAVARLCDDLGDEVGDRLGHDLLDLADLGSVRDFAARRAREDGALHGLVHNAGAMFDERAETVDGLERTYQIHVVAPFLLTASLLPPLAAGAPSRVVTVTSGGMYAEKLDTSQVDSPDGYGPTLAYARAKRAQVTLTREWARRFRDRGIGFHVMHPGWALTPGVESSLPVFRRITGPVLRTPDQGADTAVYLTLAEGVDATGTGRLWHDRRPRGEHKVPWTLPERGEAGQLWSRVCRDGEVEPKLPTG